jgi:nicotinamide riboside transporter PnuC
MDLLTILSIVSLIATVVGLYELGEKRASGFIIFTLSLCCQMYIFYVQKNWFLVCQMVVLIVFNIYNYFKWTRGT